MEQEQVTKKLKKIIDKLASSEGFVKTEDILKEYVKEYQHKVWNDAKDGSIRKVKTSEANILKELINGDLKGKLVFLNGKSARDGFRYAEGCEHYYAMKHDEKRERKAVGDEKKLLQTDGLQMLMDVDPVSSPEVELECVKDLHNLNLVKVLLKYIGKRVISFDYNTGYKGTLQRVILHPHLLKEYNSRWFVFGYAQQPDKSLELINCSLDRVVFNQPGDIMPQMEIPFQPAPRNCYRNYFNDIVGVTRHEGGAVLPIVVQTLNHKVHNLIKTKKIHPSQVETKEFKDGCGVFTLRVVPNVELQTRLLSYGDGICVKGCAEFVQRMARVVMRMAVNYGVRASSPVFV